MPRDTPLTPLPPNIELITEYDAIVLRRSWRSAAAYFFIVFTLGWNAFMVVWMTMALKEGIWMMAAFGSLHALVGIGLIYFTIASFVNRTDLRIDSYQLSVKHAPLPWFGQKSVKVEDVQQVFCKRVVSQGKNRTHVSYQVNYLDTRNRSHKLLTGLSDADQAAYIESEIEKTLGIKNRPVSGEYNG